MQFSKPSLFGLLLLSSPALAEITVVEHANVDLSVYGKLSALARYQSDPGLNNDEWQFQDNSSRVGVRLRYYIGDESSLYGNVEYGSKFHAEGNDDKVFLRRAYAGLRNSLFRVYYGKQNSLYKRLENYDFSYKLGGIAHNAREELGNSRPDNTLYFRTSVAKVRFEGQYQFSRSIDNDPRLRVGSQSFTFAENEVDFGYGLSARFKPFSRFTVRVAHQGTTYLGSGSANSLGTTAVWKPKQLRGFELGAHLGHVSLKNDGETATQLGYGMSSRYELFNDFGAYVNAEWLMGGDALSEGEEFMWLLGADYELISDFTVFAEVKQTTFDAAKAEEQEAAIGFSYRF
uniref:porin n=1 Tax=Thaumasiovibrio occultus TaxID=1891184 RepID=UPI000B363EDA|nr:porin [Thaumasiovibrio occultus]